ncbi:MAG: DUF2071 domain-containing protein [Verrucomicrobiota bacterium]
MPNTNPQRPTPEQRLVPRNRPPESPVMFQRWEHLLFLHWPISPTDIQATLPPGLHVDTFDNQAYLAIVPFYMQAVRPRFLPCVPGLSWFLELNLRTYVHDDQGRPGVWFYSLDCNQPLAVELARNLFHLPYQHAHMSAAKRDETIYYYSSREKKGRRNNPNVLIKNGVIPQSHWKTNPPSESATYTYTPTNQLQTAQPDTLDFFLLERYLLFSTTKKGTLKVGQVHHQPYPYQPATCPEPSTLPFAYNGFPQPKVPPTSTLYSPGVSVEIFPLKPA